ncbi:MAG: hypothetical protein HF978_20125 [Desulfobacteraceae bacterium]|nr:hypothetical protein [Desulfobacteraceae bacterium]MBC2757855.1 hypothetical protein [Desulfobacteraceae bacterium]
MLLLTHLGRLFLSLGGANIVDIRITRIVIIDLGARLIPIEVKSGHTIAKDFFKGLNYWATLSHNLSAPVVLIYAGNRSLHHKSTVVYSWWNF